MSSRNLARTVSAPDRVDLRKLVCPDVLNGLSTRSDELNEVERHLGHHKRVAEEAPSGSPVENLGDVPEPVDFLGK